jgi:hypothetical protein
VQGRGLLELAGQVLEQARGRDDRLQSQPCDQPVNDHMGEPFDLGIDGWDRLVGELFGGTDEGAHALINSSVTLEAAMMGLESSVKWRGTDKVRATSLALPRVYARCPPEDAPPPGRIAVTGIGLPGPGSAYGQRRRAHGGTQLAGWPAWLPGLLRCGLLPPRRGLIEKRRDRLVNRQPATGGAGCRLDDVPARRGAGAPARLVQYERTGKGLHHAKDSRTKADSTGGLG